MDKDLKKEIAEIVCQAWNELDASLFKSILSEDFEYISVWVIETMKGKDRYMDYITGKFESIKKGNNPVTAEVIYQEVIDKHVVVLNQGGNLAALEPTIQDNMLKSLWMRPIEMTLPAVFTSKKPISTKELKEEKQETEYGRFSRLFLEALMSKDFSKVDELLAEEHQISLSQIVIDLIQRNLTTSNAQIICSVWIFNETEWRPNENTPIPP